MAKHPQPHLDPERVDAHGRRRSRAVVVWAVFVLVAGAAATAGTFDLVRESARQYAGKLVDRYSDDVVTAITEQADRYGQTLTDLADAIGAQSDLTSASFSRITAGLNATRFPGATGVAWVVPAATNEVSAVQSYWREKGADALRLAPDAATDDHEFVIFDHAFTPGADLQGIDLHRSPPTSAALRAAHDSGALAISPAYRLLRDQILPAADRQTSVILAAPVFAAPGTPDADVFAGWLVMGLHGQDFLNQPLLERAHSAVQIALIDPTSSGTVIATMTPGTRLRDDTLIRQHSIMFGQRRWHVTVWPTTRLFDTADRGLEQLTVVIGSILTLILATLAGVLTSSRNRALDQVDRATAALRHDISQRKRVEMQLRERERELQHLAFHDPLTGLANRLLFYERVTHAITGHEGPRLAILFLDLDGFKPVNDTLGHDAGDTVLKTAAARLVGGVRVTDTVARLGGDEFAVMLAGITSPEDARAAAAHILAGMQQPIPVNGTTVTVSASIGIAINQPGADANDVLRDADAAMYAAKARGKNGYVFAGQ